MMTNKTRKSSNAQTMADRLNREVALEGWIIVEGLSCWYGPYATEDQARGRIGALDSLDMRITGTVVKAGE